MARVCHTRLHGQEARGVRGGADALGAPAVSPAQRRSSPGADVGESAACLCVCLFQVRVLGCLIDVGLPWNASRRALADDEARPEYPAVPQSYESLQTAQCSACAAVLEIKSIGFKSIGL